MIWLLAIAGLLFVIVVYDLLQKRHAILRNFPILGRFRYLLETVGPRLASYVTVLRKAPGAADRAAAESGLI